jgi:hypothetical protein
VKNNREVGNILKNGQKRRSQRDGDSYYGRSFRGWIEHGE